MKSSSISIFGIFLFLSAATSKVKRELFLISGSNVTLDCSSGNPDEVNNATKCFVSFKSDNEEFSPNSSLIAAHWSHIVLGTDHCNVLISKVDEAHHRGLWTCGYHSDVLYFSEYSINVLTEESILKFDESKPNPLKQVMNTL